MRVQAETSSGFTIYNLQSDTEYDFQVFATNSKGQGPGSDIIRARTKSKPFVVQSCHYLCVNHRANQRRHLKCICYV